MDKKRIRILQDIDVYAKHDLSAHKISKLNSGQIIDYNREKRRAGVEWFEIFLDDGKKGYIKNEPHTFFVIKSVVLGSDIAMGLKYTQKTEPPLRLNSLIFRAGHFSADRESVEKVEVKTVFSLEEERQLTRTYFYDKDVVDVKEIYFTQDDQFYITDYFSDFMEVEDVYGIKSVLLKETEITNKVERSMVKLSSNLVIAASASIFVGFLISGWLVKGKLLILAGAGIAFVIVYVIQYIIQVLRSNYEQVKKRL